MLAKNSRVSSITAARSKAADERELAESAQLSADASTRAQGAEAQRIARLRQMVKQET